MDYFLDKLQGYELNVILDILEISSKQSWEQTRFLGYIIAQTQSTKHLSLTDIAKFSWDKEDKKDDTSMTKEDVERLTKKMNEIIKQNKN